MSYLIGAIIIFLVFLSRNIIVGFILSIFLIFSIIRDIANKNDKNSVNQKVRIKSKNNINQEEEIKLSQKLSNNISNLAVPDDLYFYNFPTPTRYSLSNEEQALVQKAVFYKRKGNYLAAEKIYLDIYKKYGASVALYVSIAKVMICQSMFNTALKLMSLALNGAKNILGKNDDIIDKHCETLTNIITNNTTISDIYLYLKRVSENSNYNLILRKNASKQDKEKFEEILNNISNKKESFSCKIGNLYIYQFPIPERYFFYKKEKNIAKQAFFYKQAGNYSYAQKLYLDILQNSGASIDLYIEISKLLVEQREFDKSIRLVEIALTNLKDISPKIDPELQRHFSKLKEYLLNMQIPEKRENLIQEIKKEKIELNKKFSLEEPDDLYTYDFPIPTRYSLINEEQGPIQKAILNKKSGNYFNAEETYLEIYNKYGASVALYVVIAKTMICQGMFKEALELIKLAIVGTKNILGENDTIIKNDYNLLNNIIKGELSTEVIYLYLIQISENFDYQPILRGYNDEKIKNIFYEISKNLKDYQSKLNKDLIKKYESEVLEFNKKLGIISKFTLEVPDDLYTYDFSIPTRYSLSNEEQALVQKAVLYKREGNYLAAEKIYLDIYKKYGASVALYVSIAKVMICQSMFNTALKLMDLSAVGAKIISEKNNDIIEGHCETLNAIIANNISIDFFYLYLTEISGNPNYKPILRENADEQMKKIFKEVFKYYQSESNKNLIKKDHLKENNKVSKKLEKETNVQNKQQYLKRSEDLSKTQNFSIPIKYGVSKAEEFMIKKAVDFQNIKKYSEVENIYITIFNIYGSSCTLYVYIAKLLIAQGKFEEASTLMELAAIGARKILKNSDPIITKYSLTLNDICDNKLSNKEIITFLNEIFENNDIKLENNDSEKKEENINQIRKIDEPQDPTSQYKLGLCYVQELGVEADYYKAFKWSRKAAEQRYVVDAQGCLGLFYEEGQGGEKNYYEAFEWYKKAAEQGYVDAQCCLGAFYEEGLEVNQDYEEAFKWYKKAAEQGYADAQFLLGLFYANGKGIEQDYKTAVKWYKKAAEQGHAEAQSNLGNCYENGRGVEQDYVETVKWYKMAAEQGADLAQYNLGLCYENGRGVEQDYTEAVKWYKMAAEQGYDEAQSNLGTCYENGQGVEQDYTEAVKWYKMAAEQGNIHGQHNLGNCYISEHGVEQDYVEAVKWLKKSAIQGHMNAQNTVGLCYENGYGVEQDYTEAAKWYKMAAEQGYSMSQYNLGNCYMKGQGVKQNHTEAVKWFKKSAEQGDIDSQYNLGLYYLSGQGIKKDVEKAIKLLKIAAAQGHMGAYLLYQKVMNEKK